MKVLAISHEFPPLGGGGANACYFITKKLVEKSHTVTLITTNFQDGSSYEVINGVKIIRIKSRRSHLEYCSFKEMLSFLYRSMIAAVKECSNNKYDICLVFFGIPSGPVGYCLKRIYGIPYVIRFGGGDIPGFQDRFLMIYKLIGPFIKAIWKNADRLIANSDGLKKMAREFYSKKYFHVIPNGVDTEIFHPIDVKEKKYIELLFVSRLIERKGLQYVIPQLRQLMDETERDIRLTVVGDGPYRDTLEKLVKRHELEEVVHFEGMKSKDELVSYYQRADVFILPSKKEGMPNVVLEAMACGLPIVMTKCQGATELIDGNGFSVDVNDFSNKLCEIISDDDLRTRMGEESLNRINNYFTWDITVDGYIEIMEDILQ